MTDKKGETSVPVKNDIEALHVFTQMQKNVDFAGTIVYNAKGEEVFNFGKHKGKTVEEVFRNEPSYYDWMQNGMFPLYTKKKLTELRFKLFNKKI
jgi:DNA polymerase-3 subunit epsilon